MARTPSNSETATTYVGGIVESYADDVARSGGRGLVKALESWLSRISPLGLKAIGHGGRVAAGVIKVPLSRLVPIIGRTRADLVEETIEGFLTGVAEGISKLPSVATDAQLTAVAGTEAVRAASWYQVRDDLIRSMTAKRVNFGSKVMETFGDTAEQCKVMETVQQGVALLAASQNPADLQLLTQIDFTTAENIRFFLIATQRALHERAAGRPFITDLAGAAMVITPTDSATPRALVLLGQNVVGGMRDWATGVFTTHVRPAVAREWEYTAPATPRRGWFARMFNPAPSWSFRESNLRMKAEWLGELLGGLVGSWVKLIAATMGIFMVTSLLMLLANGTGHPVMAMTLAGVGAAMGYAAFIVNLIYAPLAIDLGRFLVGTPMLVGAALVNLLRGEDAEKLNAKIDPATINHLRDIRWRVALATLGLPVFLLMAAMIVGPTLNAFVIAFLLGGVSATVSVAAHFVDDDALNKRLMKQGTIVGFPIVFAVAVLSLLNAGTFYNWDTGTQFTEVYTAGMWNVGEILYYSIPVIVMGLLTALAVVWTILRAFSGRFGQFVLGSVMTAVLALLLFGAIGLWPKNDTPTVHVPVRMERALHGGALPPSASSGAAGASAATPSNPWDESYADDLDF